MDKVIMPELITPVFAEMIAENPELLKMIMDHQPGEEVIMGQNCTLDCNSNPTNVKLIFCNVTIGVDESEDESDNGFNSEDTEEQSGSCHIKIGSKGFNQKGMHWGTLSSELSQLRLEVAVLETKISIFENMLRLIPRQACNRKVIARCKIDLNEALEKITECNRELEYKTSLMQS